MPIYTNCTPYAVDEFVGYDRDGVEFYAVCAKAAYTWNGRGELTLCDEPPTIESADVYAGDPQTSGPVLPGDHVPIKPKVDVVLAGNIQLPAAVSQADITLVVGTRIRKTIRVFGERYFMPAVTGGLTTDSPRPFSEMPIDWGRAYGGADPAAPGTVEPRNPAGRGVRRHAKDLEGTFAPNFVDPSAPTRPIGFGPVAPHWQPRVRLAGTYDKAWEDERFPLLPVDFDTAYYNTAPVDQQLDGYLAGEIVELHYMTRRGHDRFALPHLDIPLNIVLKRAVLHQTRLRPDTILIEPDKARLSITARALYHPRPDMFVIRQAIVGHLSPGRRRALEADKKYINLREGRSS